MSVHTFKLEPPAPSLRTSLWPWVPILTATAVLSVLMLAAPIPLP